MGEDKKNPPIDHAFVLGGIIVNILSVVGIVGLNKHIQAYDGFSCIVLLSAFHFIFTGFSLRIMLSLKLFQFKKVPLRNVIIKAALDCASVGFMNISLAYNTVGTYQLSKLCLIPVTVAVQFVFWGHTISTSIFQILLVFCFALGTATVTDVSITLVGLGWASVAVFATVFSQILTSKYLHNLNCDALQLLYHTSPWISVGMLLMAPLFDDFSNPQMLMSLAFQPTTAFRICLSAILALLVNVTNYLVLGKTSALTYQVTGHLKAILTLAVGYFLLDRPAPPKNLVATSVALVAMAAYAAARHAETDPSWIAGATLGRSVWAAYSAVALAAVVWPVLL